jgi:serine protease
MKYILTKLVILFLLTGISVYAADPNKSMESNQAHTYHGSLYKSGVLIVNVKPQYRQSCSLHSVDVPELKVAMNKISATSVDKKFFWVQEPKEKVNQFGQKLIDLSLVYEIKFPSTVDIQKAMNIVMSSGAVEYAEPHYIHKMDFIPNDPDTDLLFSGSYFIRKIKADSAFNVFTGDTNVVIGIVDSGTDWDHPDLSGNIKYNYADPINGTDDDNDGFTDNFRGWDISMNDNDPMVNGQPHGSHVSGCAAASTNNNIGVASPGYNCKFIGVKCSIDSSQTIDNGFDGMVYAADHGVNVINCSWGRKGFPSQFEQQTVDYCIGRNVTVIAAAGNDGEETDHYPSSYENVISVAATSSNDNKSSFSNFGRNIDVCAPGTNIYSTWFDDTYTNLDGTSMASPIAAGCAAMIKARFPSLSCLQVGEQLRATCDNIYSLGVNQFYQSKLGKGRVNLYRAITDSLCPGVILVSNSITDNNDNAYLPSDTLRLTGLFQNLLRPTTNLVCSLATTSTDVTLLQAIFNAGVVNTFDTISNYNAPFQIFIKPTAPLNTPVELHLFVKDGSWFDRFLITITVNVDFINIAINNVGTTIISNGVIGRRLNAIGQWEGLGFVYKNSATILYDAGFMVGAANAQVSDNVRGATGNDDDWLAISNAVAHDPGTISDFDVNGSFSDNGAGSITPLPVVVRHNAYAWRNAPDDYYVMVQYIIRNTGADTLHDVWAGIFADWDIPQYIHNKCETDMGRKMGYIYSTDSAGLYGGIKVLSHTGIFNHYALDNVTNSGIDLSDGYSNAEKYTSLSTMRTASGTGTPEGNDVLSVVSTGPFQLLPGDSVEVAFALLAGKDLTELNAAADAAQTKYMTIGIEPIANARGNSITAYPNPADKQVSFRFSITERNQTELSIYNVMGQKVKTVIDESLSSGMYTVNADVHDLPAGNYIYKIRSGQFSKALPMTIVR